MTTIRQLRDLGIHDVTDAAALQYVNPSMLDLPAINFNDNARYGEQSLDTLANSLSDGWPAEYGPDHAASTEFYAEENAALDLQSFDLECDQPEQDHIVPPVNIPYSREYRVVVESSQVGRTSGQQATFDHSVDDTTAMPSTPTLENDREESRPDSVYDNWSPARSTGIADLLTPFEDDTSDSFRDFAQAQLQKIEHVQGAAFPSDTIAVTDDGRAFARQTSAALDGGKLVPISSYTRGQ